jgi:UV excision repair protein RAD23
MPSVGAGQTASTVAEPASSFNDPSALLVGQQGNSVISQMEAMGFERSQIDRAMRAAFFNPDRAIEYLLNGIPESVQAEQRQGGGARGVAAATSPPPTTTTAAAPTSPPVAETGADEPVNLFEAAAQAGQGQGGARGGAAARSGTGAATGGAPTGAVNMDFLRNSPHFQHLRQLVQQQPAMLEPILQQVAEGNPQLAQMIGQNQDQFLQLLSEVCSMHDNPQNIPLLKTFTGSRW